MGDHEVLSLTRRLDATVSSAIGRVLPEAAGADPVVRRSEHADFQSNAALALAKRARAKPVEIAATVVEALGSDAADAGDGGALVAEATVSGPGFVNLTVPDATLWRQVAARLASPRLGVGTPQGGSRTVIDYSCPNIAKEMHVGHLRATIVGDCLARVLGFLGAAVIRQNHLGDWGTQFGMLIQYLDEHPEARWHHNELAEGSIASVSALDSLYRAARADFGADSAFADRARRRVIALQSGDEATLARWRDIVAESQLSFQALYYRLGVLLTPDAAAGESTYNPHLADVVDELVDRGVAVDSDGALCVFPDGDDAVTGPDGTPIPLIVRKADGGYGYDTTDLAAVRYRTRDLKTDRIL